MAVRIRLRRVGRKNQPSYRIVVADSADPRDGNYIDALGFYNPRTSPAELRLDLEKTEEWIGKGAEPSTTVASLIRKARTGGDATVGYYGVDGAEMPEDGRKTRVAPPKRQKRKVTAAPAGEAVAGAAPAAEAKAPAAEAAPEPEAEAAEAPEAEAAEAPEAEAAEEPDASTQEVAEPEAAEAPEDEVAEEPEAAADEEPASDGADEEGEKEG